MSRSTSEELPKSLEVLAEDLDGPGPARWQTPPQGLELVERALTIAAADRRPRLLATWPVRVGVVAAVVLVGTAAAALLGDTWRTPTPAQPSSLSQAHPSSGSGAALSTLPAPAEKTPPVPVPSPPAPPQPELSAAVEPPADLLAEANRLRRAGDLPAAEATYLKIVRTQPSSSAAYVARVAVGKLRLATAPQRAVEILQQARAGMPGGPLDVEVRQALVNAYRALGQGAAEAAELRALLERYPESVGAAEARKRLRVLTAPATSASAISAPVAPKSQP